MTADNNKSTTPPNPDRNWLMNIMPAQVKDDAPEEKPKCIEQKPTIYQAPFSNCTSLLLDFENAPDGPINTKDFNIYTGPPEANKEAQYYTDSLKNVGIKNGSLSLSALKQSKNGYRYTSARINTSGKHDFKYGKISIRALIPSGTGTWPAIWMLATDNKYKYATANTDPNRNLNDGEIDIVESVGTEPNVVYGVAHSLATPATGEGNYFNKITVPDNSTVFHDYGLEWTPTKLTYTVDGKAFFIRNKQPDATFASWPYDQRYHLIINLALGGTWGGRDKSKFPVDGVDPKILPATMKIESISYYRYIAP